MPIYEYQCAACGHQLEAFQTISEPVLTQCPACQQASLSKLISSTSFQLKGTGWYATDFRDKGKPAAKTETAAESTTKTDASTTTSSTTSDTTAAS